jgi:hypothetical protein
MKMTQIARTEAFELSVEDMDGVSGGRAVPINEAQIIAGIKAKNFSNGSIFTGAGSLWRTLFIHHRLSRPGCAIKRWRSRFLCNRRLNSIIGNLRPEALTVEQPRERRGIARGNRLRQSERAAAVAGGRSDFGCDQQRRNAG